MAVVIRLQGLRITAGSEDIRIFFGGLKIPDGGVHIIGGVREEAFIIFASDEDARRAMVRSGGCIKGAPVNLLLSSKSEMQTILEESTKNVELELKGSPRESPGWHEEDVFGGARRADHMQSNRGARQSSNSHDEARQNLRSPSLIPTDVYVFLRGMPFEVTEQDVRDFFHGLLVEDIILKRKKWGQTNGEGMVKFATRLDARDALMRHKQYIGPRYVNVYPSTQGKWLQASGSLAVGVHGNGKFGRGRSPTRSSRSRSPLALPTHSPRSGSPLALPTHSPSRYPQPLSRSRSPLAPPTRSPRYAQVHTRSRSPLAHSPNSSSNQDFCVILKRLHSAVNKRDVKQFFHHARLEDDQILFVLNKEERTKCIFVLFDSLREYSLALTRQNEKMYDRVVHVSPISRKDMMAILESNAEDDERSLEQQASPWDSEKVCVYLRNMPFDVHKVEIMDFFFGYNITEDKVWLLRDNKGAGLGEALVVFRSEEEAMRAQSLNGQRFLGTEVMLKCISMSQMQDFGVELTAAQESILREERSSYSSRKSEGSHYPGDMEVPNIRMPTDGNRAIQVDLHRGRDPYPTGSYATQDGGNGSVHGDFGPPGPAPQFDGPTRVKIVNLPRRIQMEEIYDFCYGYCVIPGSVKCELRRIQGAWKQVANVDFESREEALRAIKELSGRPVGPRKVQLMLKE